MTPRSTLLALALLAAAPAAALAQPAPGAGPAGRGPGGMFNQLDTNKDGRVTWEETWVFIQGRFATADRDRNGGLTVEELGAAMPARHPRRQASAEAPEMAQRQAERTGMMFRMLDADRDGQVTLVEIRPLVEARFRALDANGDQAVERSEMPQRRHHHHGHGGMMPGVPAAPAPG